MKEIVKLCYFAAAVLLGFCLVIGFVTRPAGKVRDFDPNVNNFPRNWEQMEKGHPVDTPHCIISYPATPDTSYILKE